ncbi:MAG TPA: transglutaminase domain-containing protein [bacterium]|nr:transglutaminase domain-containing protein [bacterium]
MEETGSAAVISTPSNDEFLRATTLMDIHHPRIQETASRLRKRSGDPARQLFYFIRDQIRYVFMVPRKRERFLASSVLNAQRGFCTQKAILFCALARALQIPAGIWFYDIVDATLDTQIAALLKTRTLYRHGVAALWLQGAWRRLDATLDSDSTLRKGLKPVEYRPLADCLMPSRTSGGARHIDYVRDHGLVSDVSFDQITGWFRETYPHLF